MFQLSLTEAKKIVDQLNFKRNGLIVAVAQDAVTSQILMVAFADKEAITKSLTSGMAHYWSTERKQLWKKGETSGNFQYIEDVYVDCDLDAVVYRVKQVNGACHMGYKSCFFRKVEKGKLEITEESK
jgi:phosphoribosyl-AMP cyclohydrolase